MGGSLVHSKFAQLLSERLSKLTNASCYGRLAIVSDLDDGGVCPECRQGVERICRAITKQVQRSDARIEVDVMHTGNECTE
jgi:hypothetical protein